jgi:serine/threonine protein kinase
MVGNSDSESSSYDSFFDYEQDTDTSVTGNENEDIGTFISDDDDKEGDQYRLIPGFSDHHRQKACQKTFADRFAPVGLAGIGFFGVVLYAMIKFDSQLEDTRVVENAQSNNGNKNTRKLLAVKLCRPGCPSGIKDSARRLIVEIEAMKRVSQNMTKPMRSCFAELHEYNTSNEPWYSMEPIVPGMTLEHVFEIISAATHPVPEGLAFHFADQVARAYRFLHEDCKLVRADGDRRNMMLRYPGREVPVMPDIVLIDWSLWREASDDEINRDTEDMYHCLFPMLFEGGWPCEREQLHKQDLCTAGGVTHGREWLHLQDLMRITQSPLSSFCDSIQLTTTHFRQDTISDPEKAEAFRHLLVSSYPRPEMPL